MPASSEPLLVRWGIATLFPAALLVFLGVGVALLTDGVGVDRGIELVVTDGLILVTL